ncbi:type II toxin-antitoxin system ParD family antitoxin [Fulvivirga sp. M361]|uniref:type II toxin-antitoxin system ParD family antitoxin n=1 Tax=Fulvivirga sp. M361 TaxID=2594266 RepID=UPI00117A35E8|nr:type II toxin-antitoxin system ParD family antitoxin [Fulvivirga sp. M361]TRX54333.1 type II toxin-antitoxin system ParD family antitoxin [Fulvivirga sp. M361]
MGESTKTVSFTLGKHDRGFISDMVKNGRFGNRTEVVRAGLRLLEDYENNQKLQRLRVEIAKGDADIKTGHLQSYAEPSDLLKDILAKSKTHKS